MPIYEYQCEQCDEVTEVVQKLEDPPLKECAQCQGPVFKLISRSSFRLKGTGWYETDFKDKKSKSKEKSDSKDSSKETKAAGDAPKTETKPAAKETKKESPAPSASKKADA